MHWAIRVGIILVGGFVGYLVGTGIHGPPRSIRDNEGYIKGTIAGLLGMVITGEGLYFLV